MAVIPSEGAQCRTCGEWKAQNEFYLRNPETGNRFSACRACDTAYARGRVSKLSGRDVQPVVHDRDRTEKRCNGCQQMLPIDQFPFQVQRTGQRRERCRPCHNANTLAWKQANAERKKASDAAYREANREAYNERARLWHQEHPDTTRAWNQAWKVAHPDAVIAIAHKRRAAVKGNGGTYTAAEWRALKAEYDHRCLMCGQQEPAIKLTVDHVVPIMLGGPNTIDNIQPLCKSCNSKKYRGIVDLRRGK